MHQTLKFASREVGQTNDPRCACLTDAFFISRDELIWHGNGAGASIDQTLKPDPLVLSYVSSSDNLPTGGSKGGRLLRCRGGGGGGLRNLMMFSFSQSVGRSRPIETK